jgi:proline iminopeptidase
MTTPTHHRRILAAALLAAASLVAPASAQPIDAPHKPMKTADAAPGVRTVKAGDGVVLHVRDTGEGSPILLLTGGPGFSGVQLESTAAHLAATHRAILPDQRGTGKSALVPFDPTRLSLDLLIADLESIREDMGFASWTVLGHSWGGMLSMAYAAKHPGAIDALVLIDPGGIEPSFMVRYQQNLMQSLPPEAMMKLGTLAPTDNTPEAIAEVNRIMAPAMVAAEKDIEALRAHMAPDQFDGRVSMMLQGSVGTLDSREGLKAFDKPVLIVQGDQDAIGRETIETIAKTLDQAEIVIIENCGHWPMIEQPEALFKALDAFMKTDTE